MPPPWSTNPAPKTESAREARKAFYCNLCQKGYSRINELEAHEGSYDHTHRQRLKDLKHLTRASDPTSLARSRRADDAAASSAAGGSGISIKPISFSSGAAGEKKAGKSGGGGFKKGGFRNAFSAVEGGDEDSAAGAAGAAGGDGKGGAEGRKGKLEEEGGVQRAGVEGRGFRDEDEDGRWGDYDPRRPSGCGEWCKGRER